MTPRFEADKEQAGPVIRILSRDAVPEWGRAREPDPGPDQRPAHWIVLGVGISVPAGSRDPGLAPAVAAHDARVLSVRRVPDGFDVEVAASASMTARHRVLPVVVGLVAQLTDRAYLRGRLLVPPDDAAPATLLLGPERILPACRRPPEIVPRVYGPHILVDTAGRTPKALVFGAELGEAVGAGSWEGIGAAVEFDLAGLAIADDDDAGPRYVDPKAAQAHLSAHLGMPGNTLADLVTGPEGARVLSDLVQHANARIRDLSSGLPAYRMPIGVAVGPAGAEPAVAYSREQLAGLRAMQQMAAAVYGRLEPDRALAWTLEELGELAQAIRRRERDARIAEELGQVFSWLLCLSNICDVDLAEAAARSLRHEALRQSAAYGSLRPYQAALSFRSAP